MINPPLPIQYDDRAQSLRAVFAQLAGDALAYSGCSAATRLDIVYYRSGYLIEEKITSVTISIPVMAERLQCSVNTVDRMLAKIKELSAKVEWPLHEWEPGGRTSVHGEDGKVREVSSASSYVCPSQWRKLVNELDAALNARTISAKDYRHREKIAIDVVREAIGAGKFDRLRAAQVRAAPVSQPISESKEAKETRLRRERNERTKDLINNLQGDDRARILLELRDELPEMRQLFRLYNQEPSLEYWQRFMGEGYRVERLE